MYLVARFKLDMSTVSEFVAWVGVPIVLANAWLTGCLATRFKTRTLTAWSAFLTGCFMIAVVSFQCSANALGNAVSNLRSTRNLPASLRNITIQGGE